MAPFNGDAVATALARYVRDFLPETAHGVVVIRQEAEETLLGVYGKPNERGRARTALALYEALLSKPQVDVVGRGLGPRGEAWAVVVRAGPSGHPLKTLLADLLDRRVVGTGACAPPGVQELANKRVRLWCEWWHSLCG
jgi:hypothetical protein